MLLYAARTDAGWPDTVGTHGPVLEVRFSRVTVGAVDKEVVPGMEEIVITAKTEPHSTRCRTLVIFAPESCPEETIIIPTVAAREPMLYRLCPRQWRVVALLVVSLLFLTVTGLLIG